MTTKTYKLFQGDKLFFRVDTTRLGRHFFETLGDSQTSVAVFDFDTGEVVGRRYGFGSNNNAKYASDNLRTPRRFLIKVEIEGIDFSPSFGHDIRFKWSTLGRG